MGSEIRTLPRYLIDRYKGWRASTYDENRAWYAKLATEGQRPRAMVIGCCDSRVDAISLFGAEPGELFMLRNVANLVPPYKPSHEHHGTSAAIEFAITGLGITNLIVLGHAQCGGVKAFVEMKDDPERTELGGEFIGAWMNSLEPTYDRVAREGDATERLRAFEQAGVVVSLENLMTFPFIQKAVEEEKLVLHGAWFDIATGTLHHYDPENGAFQPLG